MPAIDTLTRIIALALPLVWAALAALLLRPRFQAEDLTLYFAASRNALLGMIPYRDFSLEYPPLALVPMIVPRLLWGGKSLQFSAYTWLFLLENTLLLGLLEYYVLRIGRMWMNRQELRRALICFGALALIGTPILAWRLDLFLAVITAAAVLAALEDRPDTAGAMIGIGFATKLYPVVLLPVLAARYAAEKDWRRVLRVGGAAAVVSTFAFLPFVVRAGSDILSFIRYHAMRGLEIESVAAGVIMLVHTVRGLPLAAVINYGALHLRAPAGQTVLHWLPAIFLVAIGVVTAAALRGFGRARRDIDAAPMLCAAVVASLLVFILANKVFSPQYLAWLLPFVPFAARGRRALAIAVFALTIVLFPYNFDHLVQMQISAVLLLNVRNLLALALAVWLVLDLSDRWLVPVDAPR